MGHIPKDYFIMGDLLITFENPLFRKRDKLDEISRKELLSMHGVFIRGNMKGLTVCQRRELTKLYRIKSRHRWHAIDGTWPPHQYKGWINRNKEQTNEKT